jgi:lysozyme family protein
VHGDDVTACVGLVLFDGAVNQGPARSIRQVQEALCLNGMDTAVDGKLTADCFVQITQTPALALAKTTLRCRRTWLYDLAQLDTSQREFLRGSVARLSTPELLLSHYA